MDVMKEMIKNCLIPRYKNSFYPYLLRKQMLAGFTLLILVLNLMAGHLGSSVYAGSIKTSVLVETLNSERRAEGMGELEVDPRLVSAAYEKAEDIFEHQYWSHYGPDGQTPWDFILGNGYSYVYAGENLAKGFSSSEGVHSAWMASKTHRENILNPSYNDVGIAVVSGELNGSYVVLVVQMFGSLTETEGSGFLAETSQNPASYNNAGFVEIMYPRDGDVIADNDFRMEGTSGSNIDSLKLYDNGGFESDVICEEGIWDYRPVSSWNDGYHIVKVVAGNQDIDDEVGFTVDTVAPVIIEDSLEVKEIRGLIKKIEVEVEIEGEPKSVILVAGEFSEDMSGAGQFRVEIPVAVFSDGVQAKIIAADEAGNNVVLDVSSYVLGVSTLFDENSYKILGNIGSDRAVSLFNRLAVIGIAVLLFVDAVYLLKLNILSSRGKTLFPIAIWIFVLGIGMVVGSGGTIS